MIRWECSRCGAPKSALVAEMAPEAGDVYVFRCRECGTLGDPTSYSQKRGSVASPRADRSN